MIASPLDVSQWVVALTLAGALALFASGRVRHDVVAILTLLIVVLAGIVPVEDAFVGFSNSAVITVAAVLIISRTLQTTGVVAIIARRTRPLTSTFFGHLGSLSGGVLVASSFMNNIGALGLMMPVAIETARERSRSAGLFLMPMAFCSLLGGMVTLIGTPPNIIIASFRREATGEPFRMFDFTPVGLAVAVGGLIFIVLAARYLLPAGRVGNAPDLATFDVGSYFTELRVEAGSEYIGRPLRDLPGTADQSVQIVGLEREGRAYSYARYLTLREGDNVIVQTDPASLAELTQPDRLTLLKGNEPHRIAEHNWQDIRHVEAVVPPGSVLEGRRMRFVGRRLGRTGYVLGVSRAGARLGPRLRNITFQAGDVLLIQGEADELTERLNDLGLLPLAERDISVGVERRIALAIGIFAIAIGCAAMGWAPAAVSFVAAVVAYVLTGLLPVRDLYRGIDWPIIVLLGAMFPLGQALETTGLTQMVAGGIVGISAGWPEWSILLLVLVVTMWLTDVINNAATAIVMAPIGTGIARVLEVSIDPFLIAVAIGASAAFLTPIGHQSNMLVMGPGGYRFSDYWRLGLPLEAVVAFIALPMILWIWPLS